MTGWPGKAWFRRQGFAKNTTFEPQQPKWHRLAARETGYVERHGAAVRGVRVTAICGYSYAYERSLHTDRGPFEWRDEVKTKKLRCAKCDKKLKESE